MNTFYILFVGTLKVDEWNCYDVLHKNMYQKSVLINLNIEFKCHVIWMGWRKKLISHFQMRIATLPLAKNNIFI